jgi:hypothetical protein
MVAGGQDIDAHIQKFLDHVRSQAETGRGIFAIGYHQVNRMLVYQARQGFTHQLPPRTADNITYKQDFQNDSRNIEAAYRPENGEAVCTTSPVTRPVCQSFTERNRLPLFRE